MWMRSRVPGSKKLPGAIFNVRLLHGPEGVSLMDETNIPAISTKQQNHPRGGFFVCGSGVKARPLTGSTKLSGTVVTHGGVVYGPKDGI